MMYTAVKTNRVELSEDVLEWVIGGAAAPVIYETTAEEMSVPADETPTGKVKRPAQSSANKEKKLLVSGH